MNRHQLPRLPLEEELAKRQVAARQDDDGQARPSVLSPLSPFSTSTLERTTSFLFSAKDDLGKGQVHAMHHEPRTLLPTPLSLHWAGCDWELMHGLVPSPCQNFVWVLDWDSSFSMLCVCFILVIFVDGGEYIASGV